MAHNICTWHKAVNFIQKNVKTFDVCISHSFKPQPISILIHRLFFLFWLDFNRLTGLLCGREIWNDTVDEVYVESATLFAFKMFKPFYL